MSENTINPDLLEILRCPVCVSGPTRRHQAAQQDKHRSRGQPSAAASVRTVRTDISASKELVDPGRARPTCSPLQRSSQVLLGKIIIVHGVPPRPRWRNGGEVALDGHAGDTSPR